MERILKSKYKILEKISESSSHVTYNGAYVDSGLPLIIKIYKREYLNNYLIKQLKKDAAFFSGFASPSVPRLLDGDYGWQGFYFVREHIDGKPLSEFKMPVEPDAAASVILKICDVLEDAHSKGFVHGSLTPQNIFICGKNGLMVSDFGIHHSVIGPVELRAASLMTEDSLYMAPEIILGDQISPSSDIYQTGLLLYLLLTGDLPVKGRGGMAGALLKISRQLPPVSSVNSKVPGYLDEIVMRCLDRDPLLRFPDITKLKQSLGNKAAVQEKTDISDIPAVRYKEEEPAPPPKKEEIKPAPAARYPEPYRAREFQAPPPPKGDRINIFKWIMFLVWLAILSGIIYSLVNILVIGE